MVKYKIAIILKLFPKLSETFILNQITDLISKGHQIHIYSFGFGDKKIHQSYHEYDLKNKTIYFIPPPKNRLKRMAWLIRYGFMNYKAVRSYPSTSPFKKRIHELHFDRQLSNFLQSQKFDVVHAHFGQRGAVVANLIERRLITKTFFFVTSFHGYDLTPKRLQEYKATYQNLFKYSDAITVNSKYLEDLLLKVNPSLTNISLLPESLRTSQYIRRKSAHSSQQSFVILFIGRLVEFKAPDLAVDIVSRLISIHRSPIKIELRIIGTGKLENEVKQKIADNGVQSSIKLLGSMTQEEVISEIENADVFLLPGVYEKESGRAEAQGLVVQEAQAMELPVIVSDAGGTRYGLVDGKTGFVVAARDIDAFVHKLSILMTDATLRVQMGKAGRQYVCDNFDTEKLGDQLVRLYGSVELYRRG